MNPILLKGLFDTGSSLIGSGVQQIFGERNMKLQQRYSKDLLKYQWDNQTPSVVNSLRKAGLNVGLMYSNGGPSVGSSTGHTTAPNIGNPLTGLGELINQADLTESAKDVNEATANEKRVNALLNEKKALTEEIEQKYKGSLTETEQAKKNEILKRIEKIDADIKNSNRLTDAEVRLKESQTAWNEQQIQRDIEMLPIDKANKESLTALNLANASGVYKENLVRDSVIQLRKYEINKMTFETRKIYTEQLRTAYQFYFEQKYNRKMSSGVQATVDAVVSSLFGLKPEETITERYPWGKFNHFIFGAGSFIGRTKEMFDKLKQLDQQTREALEPFAEWLKTIELP